MGFSALLAISSSALISCSQTSDENSVATTTNQTTTATQTTSTTLQPSIFPDATGLTAPLTNPTPPSTTLPLIPDEAHAIDIQSGTQFVCALLNDNTVACWGGNSIGQLGANSSRASNPDVPDYAHSGLRVKQHDENGNIVDLHSVKAISSKGIHHTCAIHFDTTVSCWGWNTRAQLGHPSKCSLSSNFTHPQGNYYNDSGNCAGKVLAAPDIELTGVLQISNGVYHSCALIEGGTVKCWGDNYYGQMANAILDTETPSVAVYPVEIPNINDAIAVSSGLYNACTLHTDGTISCWGYANFGMLGDGIADTFNKQGQVEKRIVQVPTKVKQQDENGNLVNLNNVKNISAGTWHICALHTDNTVSCWGQRLEDFRDFEAFRPEFSDLTAKKVLSHQEPLIPIDDFTSIDAGERHNCATRGENNALYCWGVNYYGLFGIADEENRNVLIEMKDDGVHVTDTLKVSTGGSYTCVIYGSDNEINCWGSLFTVH